MSLLDYAAALLDQPVELGDRFVPVGPFDRTYQVDAMFDHNGLPHARLVHTGRRDEVKVICLPALRDARLWQRAAQRA
ncbi:MAG TPA: hypothetical protein VEH84_05825 [Alphaproteobacteria bacterium]|nr:hypothetical protein [Alphaproteobacteria bacterium]